MIRRIIAACGLVSLFACMANAENFARRTVITLGEPVIVAGVETVTLQPGTYVFRLKNHGSNRNIVEIFNEREDQLFATVLTIPNYRLEPAGKTVLRFWETPEGNPVALRAWFFPGDRWGQEFVYPEGVAARIALETGGTVPAVPPAATAAELAKAPVTQINRAGEEQRFEYDQYTLEEIAGAFPAAEPEIAPKAEAKAADTPVEYDQYTLEEIAGALEPGENQPTGDRTTAPLQLPATGSALYLLGLMGVASMLAGAGLKRML